MHPHKAHSEPKISFLRLASERPEWSDGDRSVAGHQQIRNEIVSASSLPVLQVRQFEMEGRPNHKTLVDRLPAAQIAFSPVSSARASVQA